ncbi:MAG: HD domain-containing protein [Micromonosporaceae bacterium]|nr:HD domain-containing protein [Micromonosporaceae bacterium]
MSGEGDPIGFVFETGLLKRAKRTGWWMAGIKDPESIAEHSFRAAVIGAVLAAMEGADPARVLELPELADEARQANAHLSL